MKIRVNGMSFLLFIMSFISSLLILFKYNGENEYILLPLIPFAFGIMVVLASNVICDNIPSNYGITILVLLLTVRSVLIPAFLTLGDYKTTFGQSIADNMNTATLLTVYEIVAIFVTLILLNNRKEKYENKIKQNENRIKYNFQAMRFLIVALMLLFAITFVIVPECKYFYLNLSNITDMNFANNEMSSVIDQYATDFVSKLILVLHNYLTKIVRFLLPLHIIFEIARKNNRKSGYFLSAIVASINIFIIDGTIARGFVYAFILLLLTCIIYEREKDIYKITIIAVVGIVAYFSIRTVFTVIAGENVWTYLSRYIGSYFSSPANTAACLNMDMEAFEKIKFMLYDYLESIPFGNTIFGLDSISFQADFNAANSSYGQIPTTIGALYLYFGAILSPLYSILFTVIAFKAGIKARKSNSIMRKGVYLLLAMYAAMALTMYYLKIVMVVIIGTIIPMLIICRLVEHKYSTSNRIQ